jgi:NADP-dependent 3-hydroxy acid dehydrogenase YdfG
MIDVNLKGVLYGIAAVLPHMKAQRRGGAVYAATKTAGG